MSVMNPHPTSTQHLTENLHRPMKIIRLIGCALVFAATFLSAATAQVSTGSILPGPITLNADGITVFTGTLGSGGVAPSGPGVRMVWSPAKAAFRAGAVGSNVWDDAYLGVYSFAAGYGTLAYGNYTGAFGWASQATGYGSFAAGNVSLATGYTAVSFGHACLASGTSAVSLGSVTQATGDFTLTAGKMTIASGVYSSALGYYTTANALGSFVIGQYNLGGGSATVWNALDPIFEIGNGTAPAAKSNALTVYKNGNAVFQGVVRVAKGGDIPMFSATP